ncbi:MAG TPA: hypothetical protein VF092_15420 [Longimicrobium sp.]
MKTKLSIESLHVESFATASAEREKGTIFGNAQSVDTCTTPCGSAIDACPTSPHALTPCNGCVDTSDCIDTTMC